MGIFFQLLAIQRPASAVWISGIGLKTQTDAAVEPSDPWVGPQLRVEGGTLDFLGSANVSGAVRVRDENMGGAPVVTVAGAFNMNGPNFSILEGARLVVNGPSPGTVQTEFVTINFGAMAKIGSLIASNDVLVNQPGTSLQVMGDYQQTAGVFALFGTADFAADGSFDYVGNHFQVVDGSTFSVGNVAASSVDAEFVTLNGGSDVAVGSMSAANDALIGGAGTSLQILGDYEQTGGRFSTFGGASFDAGGSFSTNVDLAVADQGTLVHIAGDYQQSAGMFAVFGEADFDVDGAFQYAGSRFEVADGATVNVGDPANSAVNAAVVAVQRGGSVAIGRLAASGDVTVSDQGTMLEVAGDFEQSAGQFALFGDAVLEVDGSFQYTGSRFEVANGATLSVGDTAASAVNAGFVTVNRGANANIGRLSASGDVFVADQGTSLHVAGNFEQTAGVFQVFGDADFSADGTFDYVGSQFKIAGGSTFNVAGGPMATGSVMIDGGADLTVDPLTAGGSAKVSEDGDTLAIDGNVRANGSSFVLTNGHAMTVSGFFLTQPLNGPSAPSSLQLLTGATLSVTVGFALSGDVRIAGAGSHVEVGGILGAERHSSVDGTASLVLEDSATARSSSIAIGTTAGSKGAVTISTGAQLITSSTANTDSAVALSASSIGALTIRDPGTRWDSAHQIAVGRGMNSRGELNVLAGAVVESGKAMSPTDSSGIIGRFAGSVGTVTVSGAGSRWSQDGGLSVGFNGAGTLHVMEAGVVESEDGFVARFAESTGEVDVSGAGSAWRMSRALYVGGDAMITGGDGSVKVSDGGLVTVGQVVNVWSGGQIDVSDNGIVNIGAGDPPAPGVVRVGPGGSLMGSGTIVGDVLVDGGTLAPGLSPGVLSVDGDVHQLPGGLVALEIGGTTPGDQYDQLAVTGDLALEGAVQITFTDEYVPAAGARFDLFEVGGSFALGTLSFFNSPPGMEFLPSFADDVFSITAVQSNADFDGDGVVDAADLETWQAGFGSLDAQLADGDADADGDVDGNDFLAWQRRLGSTTGAAAASAAVPEPATMVLTALALARVLAAGYKRLGSDGAS